MDDLRTLDCVEHMRGVARIADHVERSKDGFAILIAQDPDRPRDAYDIATDAENERLDVRDRLLRRVHFAERTMPILIVLGTIPLVAKGLAASTGDLASTSTWAVPAAIGIVCAILLKTIMRMVRRDVAQSHQLLDSDQEAFRRLQMMHDGPHRYTDVRNNRIGYFGAVFADRIVLLLADQRLVSTTVLSASDKVVVVGGDVRIESRSGDVRLTLFDAAVVDANGAVVDRDVAGRILEAMRRL